MTWNIKKVANVKVKNPLLIEGLPGMGNVGKIAVDFMIDSLSAKKLAEITSYDLPHCVFINEDNIVELPTIEVYYKNLRNRTLLFLAGDIQPLTENSCYDFCHKILDTFQKDKLQEIITLGGIALPRIPKNPRVYCTANTKKMLQKYKHLVNPNIYGMVGPITGVSGLLIGLAGKRNIPAISLLVETFVHPNYLGVKGAREVLKVLEKELKLNLDLSSLDEEIFDIQKDIQTKTSEINKVLSSRKQNLSVKRDMNYIG